MSPDELRRGLYWLGEHLYSADATRLRRQTFYRQWRKRNPAAAPEPVGLSV